MTPDPANVKNEPLCCFGYVDLESTRLTCSKAPYHEGEPHEVFVRSLNGQWVRITWEMERITVGDLSDGGQSEMTDGGGQ